jgi:hypothetical protein
MIHRTKYETVMNLLDCSDKIDTGPYDWRNWKDSGDLSLFESLSARGSSVWRHHIQGSIEKRGVQASSSSTGEC